MMQKTLDSFDVRILRYLQQDGRLTNADLAEKIGLSATPCLRRVKALEDAGLIAGYRADLNRQKVGLGLTVMVGVKVDNHGEDCARSMEQLVQEMPEVISGRIVSGEADFLLEVVVPDLQAYETFLMGTLLKLPMVKDVRSTFVLRTLKDRAPLPLGHLADGKTAAL